MAERIRAIYLPSDDEAFVAWAQPLMEREDGATHVLLLLRETYPRAVSSVAHPFAAFDGRPTWYVYRDGGIRPSASEYDGSLSEWSQPLV